MKKLKDKVDVLRIIRGIQSELADRFTVQGIAAKADKEQKI